MKKIFFAPLIGVMLLSFTACKKEEVTLQNASKSQLIFDTVVTMQIYNVENPEILNDVFDYCVEYEEKFSKLIEGSEVWQLNNAESKPVVVSDELIEMLNKSIEISKLSDGLFDVTIEPLADLWGFSNTAKVPKEDDILETITKIGYENIDINGNEVTLKNGATIDLGGIAKGQIADLARDMLEENGVKQGLISIGGNIVAIGKKTEDTDWTVGIQEPFGGSDDIVMSVSVADKNVVTSGPYERNFIEEDVLYHHILNPKTGYPSELDLYSVSIISEDAMLSDALSTTCFLIGYEKSIELLENFENTHAIFITSENEIFMTEGIEDEMTVRIFDK